MRPNIAWTIEVVYMEDQLTPEDFDKRLEDHYEHEPEARKQRGYPVHLIYAESKYGGKTTYWVDGDGNLQW